MLRLRAVQGKLTGVGIEIQSRDRQTVVVAPIDGSPAQQAGVHAGDVITEVDGRSIVGMTYTQVQARISGDAGKSVELTMLDPKSGKQRDVKITRAAIKINNVSWQRLPGSGLRLHLRIAMFSDGESDDLEKGVAGD